MKTLTFFLFAFITIFVSCNGKTNASLQHTSPNAKVKINIIASRATSIESWKVEMKVKAYNFKEEQLAFEIYADDLNTETVSFNWTDEHHCSIIFKQSDGAEKKFSLTASAEELEMAGA